MTTLGSWSSVRLALSIQTASIRSWWTLFSKRRSQDSSRMLPFDCTFNHRWNMVRLYPCFHTLHVDRVISASRIAPLIVESKLRFDAETFWDLTVISRRPILHRGFSSVGLVAGGYNYAPYFVDACECYSILHSLRDEIQWNWTDPRLDSVFRCVRSVFISNLDLSSTLTSVWSFPTSSAVHAS